MGSLDIILIGGLGIVALYVLVLSQSRSMFKPVGSNKTAPIPSTYGSTPTDVQGPGDLSAAQDDALDNSDNFGPDTPMTCDDGYDDNGATCRCSDGNIWAYSGGMYKSTGRKAASCDCGNCDASTGHGYVSPSVTASGKGNEMTGPAGWNVAMAYARTKSYYTQPRGVREPGGITDFSRIALN